MDPGNVQASEGLHRLHKLINKDEDLKRSIEKHRSQESLKTRDSNTTPAQTESGAKSSVDHSALEEMKNKGNNFFKDSKQIFCGISFNKVFRKL